MAIAASADDNNRKPAIGMWQFFEKNCNGDVEVIKSGSFFVGDAAGRKKTANRKTDFSDSDLKFARNVGLTFYTPEEFFKNEESKDKASGGTMAKWAKKEGTALFKGEEGKEIASKEQEVIVFVGSPGAGKSSFWKNYLKSYERVNQVPDYSHTPKRTR